MRGVCWGSGDAAAIFLHEPAEDRDLDVWGDLPARLAALLDVSALALDLPGHGLSDNPWEPSRLPQVVTALVEERNPEQPTLIVAAGETATAALAASAQLRVAGVIALTTSQMEPGVEVPRSPATAKLFFAGAQSGDDLAVSRNLASSLGGWTIVTSIPTATRGSAMLATEWGPRLGEHIVAFARDILFRRHRPPLARNPAPPAR
jgi:pimeloyl-ACP methyl ester carboxylesterase